MSEIVFFAFAAGGGVLFLFYALVLIALLTYKKPEQDEPKGESVSVIVCAKNELENLKNLIPAILTQQYHDFEVILVDDKSTDGTYEWAKDLELKEDKLQLVRIDETPDHINNKKYAITLGVKAAKNDGVLLTDADCKPASDQWIKEMSAGVFKPGKKFALGYSQYMKKGGFLNQFIRFETMHTALHYIGLGLLGRPYMGVGRNLAYRRSLFLENNGFGRFSNVVGGDDDLFVNAYAKRKNTSVILSENATVYSIPKTSWKEFIVQKTRHLSVGKHYRKTDRMLLGILFIARILFWVCFFIAIMADFKTIFVISGFLLVMVLLLSAYFMLKKKTGDPSRIWTWPFLDFIYLFYYISMGLKVLFTKKVKWN